MMPFASRTDPRAEGGRSLTMVKIGHLVHDEIVDDVGDGAPPDAIRMCDLYLRRQRSRDVSGNTVP